MFQNVSFENIFFLYENSDKENKKYLFEALAKVIIRAIIFKPGIFILNVNFHISLQIFLNKNRFMSICKNN